MKSDVVTLGAATIDVLVKSPGFQVSGNSLVLPYSAKTEATDATITLGGGATNAAVSFSRLGLSVSCVAPCPANAFGQYIKDELSKEKVNIAHLYPSSETDFSTILVAPDGGRTVITYRGKLAPESTLIPWATLKSTAWFYITSLEGNLDLLEKMIGFCQDHQIKIALNPGLRELKSRRHLLSLLPYVEVLLVNRIEAETLLNTPFDSDSYWQKFKQLKVPLVALTNGRQGAHLITSDSCLYSPIINTKPVDETGAGDAFGSALIAAIIYNQPLSTALKWAINNSASVVGFLGAKAGLLRLSQLKSQVNNVGKTSKK